MSQSLAVINCLEEYVDYNKPNIKEQLDDILDDDNFYLSKFTTPEEMYEIIHKELGSPTIAVTACNIWESKHLLYAGYFIDLSEYEETTNKKVNMLGSQIVSHNVVGKLVVVKTKLSYEINNNNVKCVTETDNLTRYDFIKICESIYIKNGLSVKTDGSIADYSYIVNPLEHLILTDPKYEEHYRYHEFEFYNCVIKVILDIRSSSTTDVTNVPASFICGRIVKGDVFIAMYRKPEFNEHPPYISITKNILENIIKIRKLSENVGTNINKSDKEYINFEKLLELELNRLTSANHGERNLAELIQDPLNKLQ